jgi:hypothetical protein
MEFAGVSSRLDRTGELIAFIKAESRLQCQFLLGVDGWLK